MSRVHFAIQMAAFSLELLIKNMTRWRARGRGISINKWFASYARVVKVCAFICSVRTLRFRWRHFLWNCLSKTWHGDERAAAASLFTSLFCVCVLCSCAKSVCLHMFLAHFALQMAAFCFGIAYQKHDTVTSARPRHLYSQVCFVFAFYARVLKVCAFICSLRTLRFRWRHFVLELLIKNMTRSRARGRGISINKCVSFCWHLVFVY